MTEQALKQSVGEWEKQFGVMIGGNPDLNEQVTEDQFRELSDGNSIGVNHADRIKFLKANKYEVTRENMLDPELSHRTAEELENAEQAT